jgi:serine/threonine-protein kinase
VVSAAQPTDELGPTLAPDTAAPDTAAPDTAAPDTAAPNTAAPNTAAPDTAAPNTAAPNTAAPDIAATMQDTRGAPSNPRVTAATASGRTSTVLPRVEATGADIKLVHDGRIRYETEKLLGEGGMGTVTLARDHDIDRKVAVKQIRREVGNHGLARFVEEVRTIGSLEHPNIIPIHDVGVDDAGNYFFVMKYVEGETLEEVIERLAAGDPEAHRRYTFETRVNIFIGLLRALAFAHDRNIIHRDIKPANIMVGPYGEVVLMDWGIAKPIDAEDLPPVEGEREDPVDEKETRRRLVKTAQSALVGTPAYMSPEQARGSSELDTRSDLYSACVVFHELLTLRHYLADATTVPGMLMGVIDTNMAPASEISTHSHPTQGIPPAEYLHFLARGMKKKPEERWASSVEMIAELEAALEGKIRVQCPVTFTKRITRETSRFVDRNPRTAVSVLMATTAVVLFGIAGALYSLVT